MPGNKPSTESGMAGGDGDDVVMTDNWPEIPDFPTAPIDTNMGGTSSSGQEQLHPPPGLQLPPKTPAATAASLLAGSDDSPEPATTQPHGTGRQEPYQHHQATTSIRPLYATHPASHPAAAALRHGRLGLAFSGGGFLIV
jgi:hypothetical protein